MRYVLHYYDHSKPLYCLNIPPPLLRCHMQFIANIFEALCIHPLREPLRARLQFLMSRSQYFSIIQLCCGNNRLLCKCDSTPHCTLHEKYNQKELFSETSLFIAPSKHHLTIGIHSNVQNQFLLVFFWCGFILYELYGQFLHPE